ncbi:MAG: Tex-like N-terminal domain-containing protein, partial [Desulfobacterales bacterium]|nr:Tex-like N-terminal domain-containing protein [Desulfobacterales bacterium]
MPSTIANRIASELALNEPQVATVAALLAEGATIPFIARYRKEATGSLDEVAVAAIRDRMDELHQLQDRRAAILQSLETHGHLTDALTQMVLATETMVALEDIYLPFRPKRRTRAMAAREKGLEPLAMMLLAQSGVDPEPAAATFVNPELGVGSAEEALAGARDIVAEIINEDPAARAGLRELFQRKAQIVSQVASDQQAVGAKFRDYFDWKEPAATAPSHRVLAMRRGENEDVLNLAMRPPEDEALALLEGLYVRGPGKDSM